MTFTADSAASIRDRTLANWRARYLARGEDLSIEPGSDAWNEIDSLSLEFEGLGLGAQEAAHRVLLRYQHGQDLDDSAFDDGTARIAASKARRLVTINGPATSSAAIAGATLASASGIRFVPVDPTTGAALTTTPTTDGSGNATMTVEAVAAGSAPNALPTSTVLTWSSAPTGFAATGILGAVTISGMDAESDALLRDRLLARRRERPGGGNRSWWHEVLIVVAGVGELFVYRVCTAAPEDAPVFTPNRPGNISVVPIAPAPSNYDEGGDGMAALYSRAPSLDLVARVRGYLRGTLDREGNAPGSRNELYPAHMTEEHFYVSPPRIREIDVLLSVQAASGWRWLPEGTTQTVGYSGTSTASVVELNLPLTGYQSGDRIAFADWGTGVTRIRGGWFLRRIVGLDAVARTITLDTALPAVPPAGTPIRADAVGPTNQSLWGSVMQKTAIFFDGLGPGEGPSQTFRYPDTDYAFPTDVTRASLLRIALNVAGVDDASVSTPSASVVATIGELSVLRSFRIEKMP